MDTRRLLLRTPGTALAALALLVSGCSSGSSSPQAGSSTRVDAAPAGLTAYYGQKLKWRTCAEASEFQCATLKAPLDYAHPDEGDVDLTVSRKKATGPGKRLGSLLVNPGGPGGSAIGYLQGYAAIGYPAPVRARYDMVAVDPRGVAASEPVVCLSGKQMDTFTQVDQTPDDQREVTSLTAAYKDFAQGCEKRSAEILPHMSTVESARDMDILRAALGDGKLTYVGASYGTFLGATYADLFPARVGRLVLDGALDPSLSAADLGVDQTAGFETAFRSFTEDCVRRASCPLGTGSTTEASGNLKRFFARLDEKPVSTGESRELGESLATTGVLAAMYDENAWPTLRAALTAAMGKGDGGPLLALADLYYEREPDGSYANLMFANPAVNCLDSKPAFTGPDDVRAALPAFEKASPVFGAALAWGSMNCAYWPIEATGTPHRITAQGADPIVVVGTTRDPATPYKWSKALAGQLRSGHLLTYQGDGHTAYGRGSDCIDTAINTYLVEGEVPTDGKTCG